MAGHRPTRGVVVVLPHLRVGGAETVMVRVVNGLASRGAPVSVVVVQRGGELESEIDADVRLIHLNAGRVRYSVLPLLRTLRALRPVAVISTLGRMNLAVLLVRPFLGDCRIFVREASTPSADLTGGEHGFATKMLYPLLYPTADRIICQSEAMLHDVSETLKVPREKLVKIYNPAPRLAIASALADDESPFSANERAIVICGKLRRVKGVDIMLKAMSRVVPQVPDARLHVLGDGPDRASLEQLASGFDLENQVTFHGHRNDRFRFFRHAAVTVSASRWEGLPNVLLEAIACGSPVIATDCPGGTAEIVSPGVNGWLVPTEDPEALGDALLSYLQGTRELERGDIRESLPQFDESTIIDSYQELLLGAS